MDILALTNASLIEGSREFKPVDFYISGVVKTATNLGTVIITFESLKELKKAQSVTGWRRHSDSQSFILIAEQHDNGIICYDKDANDRSVIVAYGSWSQEDAVTFNQRKTDLPNAAHIASSKPQFSWLGFLVFSVLTFANSAFKIIEKSYSRLKQDYTKSLRNQNKDSSKSENPEIPSK